MTASDRDANRAEDAALAAVLLAIDPGLGGLVIRGAHGPAAQWVLDAYRRLLPPAAPHRRMPVQIADARLLGGLDLAATMQAGRPVFERGLLADVDGGVLVVPMAERLALSTAARLASVLDSGEVVVEREGFASRNAARFSIIAFDEGATGEERPPQALRDRLAVACEAPVSVPGGELVFPFDRDTVAAAKIRLARVAFEGQVATALCQVSAMLGIASLRAPVLALRVARAHAALCDRVTLNDDDVAVAGRLVLAPRAVVLPRPADDDPPAEQPEREHSDDQASAENGELEDVVLDAVRAAVPQGLLELMKATPTNVRRASLAGRTGAQKAALRGRPAGVRRGDPRMGARLNVVETLRAAAPWQKLRRRNSGASGTRVVVRRDDFRVGRFVQRTESATVFVVDASGSSALHRLAEAKGAVEILLADCYVRRDQVALIAFRGKAAELLLPPTRSLARAKRSLSSLPGGGGTPVASALDCAGALAHSLRRKGLTPAVVLLTDGRANVARNGAVGREPAEVDALASARGFRTLGFSSLLVDTSPAPGPLAGRLAAEMGARYLALPRADALAISRAVTDAAHSP